MCVSQYLKHLSEKIKKYDASHVLLQNAMSLYVLGIVDIRNKLHSAYVTNVKNVKNKLIKIGIHYHALTTVWNFVHLMYLVHFIRFSEVTMKNFSKRYFGHLFFYQKHCLKINKN